MTYSTTMPSKEQIEHYEAVLEKVIETFNFLERKQRDPKVFDSIYDALNKTYSSLKNPFINQSDPFFNIPTVLKDCFSLQTSFEEIVSIRHKTIKSATAKLENLKRSQ